MDALLKDGRFRPIAWGGSESGETKKAEALGWATDFGKHGRLTQVNKHSLRLDVSYQRRQSTDKARRIAGDFNWQGFGVVVVSERPNGEYFVLDGGHRVMATMMRPEVKNVPCYAFTGLSKTEEAAAFVCYNAHRKPPTGLELFAAQVLAGDEQALAVNKIMGDHAIPVGRDGCCCPRKLIHLYTTLGEEKFNALVRLAVTVWPDQPDSERMTDQVLSGLAGFLKVLEGMDLAFGCSEVVRALSKMPLAVLRKRASELQSLGVSNRGDAFRLALSEAWNKNRRVKRLPLMWTNLAS